MKKISKEALSAVGGVAVCLFALLITLSSGTHLSFLANSILTVFGFVGFWLLIPAIFVLGIYLIVRKQFRKIRFDVALWGIYIIILALLLMTSFWASDGATVTISSNNEVKTITIAMYQIGKTDTVESLNFNNAINTFETLASANGDGKNWFQNLSITNPKLGGGFVGYVLCGAFNSLITPIGTTIVFWIAIVAGVCLIFHRYIKKLFNYIKSGKQRSAARDDVYGRLNEETETESVIFNDSSDEQLEPATDSSMSSDFSSQMLNDLTIRNLNNTHGLTKATFIMDDGQSASMMESPAMQDPLFMKQNEVVEPTPAPVYEEPVQEEPSFEEDNILPSFMSQSSPVEPVTPAPQVVPTPAPQPVIQEPVEQAWTGDPLHRPQPKAVIKPPFVLPPMNLLDYHENLEDLTKNNASCESRTQLLNTIFADMRVGAEVVGHTIGPSVTRYDIKTTAAVSVQAVKRIEQDISVRLGGVPVRFVPIVLGKATSGLEMQNEIRTNVGLRESIEKLPVGEKFLGNIPFGKDISGELIHANLKDFPHLLVAGATGSGKSIFVHSCIVSLLMRNTPDQLKLVLIDPKKVEMNFYKEIPHLLCPNISDPNQAKVALYKLVDEMERRYNLFEDNHVRDIKGFNVFAKENGLQPLPTIAVFIDEYADLSEACKDIRTPVVRIAAKARSAGIHLIIATQRPSVNVIDGVIKANLPSHVALMVGNAVDSTVIIGEAGAEALLGNGDMIVECAAVNRSIKPRVQGCFVDEAEISRVTEYLRKQGAPQYDPAFLDLTDHTNDVPDNNEIVVDTAALKEASEDQLYNQIKSDLVHKEYCSISFIQRTYGVGFPKAGRLFNRLIKDGFVAPTGDARGSKVFVNNLEQSEGVTSIDESHVYEDTDSNMDENSNEAPQPTNNGDEGAGY